MNKRPQDTSAEEPDGGNPHIRFRGGPGLGNRPGLLNRKSRFSEAQIAEILKEGESGVPINDLIRKHGISRPTYFNWRSKYGGVAVSELKRMKDLESENAKLKRMYADLALENTAIKDVLSRNVWSAPLLQGQFSSDEDSLH